MDMRRPVINSSRKIKGFDSFQHILKQPFIMRRLGEQKMKWFCIGAYNLITLYKMVELFVIRTWTL